MRASDFVRRARTRLAGFLSGAGGPPLSIALLTLVVFSPALWNQFVDWDDGVNLVDNLDYRGLGWTQLRWMLTTVLMGHWIPLTWLTLGLDYILWGMNPVGYHLTNLLLHAANASVFYFVALRLLGLATTGIGTTTLRLGATASALFFALHPLRAESVAWVTERRDVLSGLFFLLTILTYLRASEAEGAGRRRWLAASVGLYVLAIGSKSIVMTLPFILILLDIYPLRRLGGRWQDWTTRQARGVWAEKVPYLVLALAGAGTALYAVRANAFLTPMEQYPLSARIAMAFYSFWFYVGKTLFPLGLSPLYELPAQVNPLDPPFVLSALAVSGITGALILLRRRWPAGLAVWASYVVLLAPVSGIPFHSGFQLAHDRYSYLSCLGLALLVGAGVCAVVRFRALGTLRPSLARLAAGAGTAWFLGLATLTWPQVQVWRDSDTLWRYALDLDPHCAICQNNLAISLVKQNQTALAIERFQRALDLRPDRKRTHGNLGMALSNAGKHAEGIEHLQRALERYPGDGDIRNNLGVALSRQGKLQEAVEQWRLALWYNPSQADAHTNLGGALTELGNPSEAIGHFLRAIELKPKAPLPHFGLARAYLALGKTGPAQNEYEVLKRLDGRLASLLPPEAKPPVTQQ
ncbi:MAG: tetratricopeptide repeat protein [Candidatus Rokubacteria bacterium]|nr:tetratricopeptide repeat protein [Candidatus Rokubacteria bacterium]